jgi:hypothetical protein
MSYILQTPRLEAACSFCQVFSNPLDRHGDVR